MKYCNKCKSDTERNARGSCKPCENVRFAKWYASREKEKDRARKAKWNAENSQKTRAYSAKYYAKNADKINTAAAQRYADNPDKKKKSVAMYRASNPEKVRSAISKWRRDNPENNKVWRAANPEYHAKWRAANSGTLRTYKHNRRARESGGRLSKSLSSRLLILQRGKCACCGKPLGDDYHLDHIMPLALGGANEDWNIQLLRQQCNNQKCAKHPIDFMQSRGFLL